MKIQQRRMKSLSGRRKTRREWHNENSENESFQEKRRMVNNVKGYRKRSRRMRNEKRALDWAIKRLIILEKQFHLNDQVGSQIAGGLELSERKRSGGTKSRCFLMVFSHEREERYKTLSSRKIRPSEGLEEGVGKKALLPKNDQSIMATAARFGLGRISPPTSSTIMDLKPFVPILEART